MNLKSTISYQSFLLAIRSICLMVNPRFWWPGTSQFFQPPHLELHPGYQWAITMWNTPVQLMGCITSWMNVFFFPMGWFTTNWLVPIISSIYIYVSYIHHTYIYIYIHNIHMYIYIHIIYIFVYKYIHNVYIYIYMICIQYIYDIYNIYIYTIYIYTINIYSIYIYTYTIYIYIYTCMSGISHKSRTPDNQGYIHGIVPD